MKDLILLKKTNLKPLTKEGEDGESQKPDITKSDARLYFLKIDQKEKTYYPLIDIQLLMNFSVLCRIKSSSRRLLIH